MNTRRLQNVISKMVDNMDKDDNDKTITLDVIMSGGAFNAIYLVGCLYFLREMENKNKIIIHRMSSCSASSLVAFLYLINQLELFQTKIYEIVVQSFKTNKTFIFTETVLTSIFEIIETAIHESSLTELDIIRLVNYKLYITYFDIKQCKRIVKKKYKSLKNIFETIKKSGYIPFITMNNVLYRNRYMDGWQPYIFKSRNTENRQFFIDLLGKDKIKDSFILKNNNSTYKIINGVLDVYCFFYNKGKCETSMCSFINNQSIFSHIKFLIIYYFSYVLCFILYFHIFFFNFPSSQLLNIVFVKMMITFVKNAFHFLMGHLH